MHSVRSILFWIESKFTFLVKTGFLPRKLLHLTFHLWARNLEVLTKEVIWSLQKSEQNLAIFDQLELIEHQNSEANFW